MSQEQHIEEIVYRYLSGEASEQEVSLVENWLKGEGSKEELERIRKILERFDVYRGTSAEVDTEAAWKKVSGRLNFSGKEKEVKIISLFSKIPLALKYAAAVALIISSYLLFRPALDQPEDTYYSDQQTVRKTVLASNNEIKVLELSEGSKITLRENTEIRYGDMADDSIRLVALDKGEAYFEVSRDEDKAFVVEAKGTYVRVLGTAFTVQVSDSGDVEVGVTEGIVRLFSDTLMNENTSHIDLIKGQKGKRTNNGLFRLEAGSWNTISWLTGNLRFSDEQMLVVIDDLRKHFDVDIIVEDSNFLNCRLTAKFKKKELNTILETLKLTFDIDVVTTEKAVVIKGKGC